MSEAVIDGLKVINVDEAQGPALGLGIVQYPSDPVFHGLSVKDSRQSVILCLIFQLFKFPFMDSQLNNILYSSLYHNRIKGPCQNIQCTKRIAPARCYSRLLCSD